ncbi:MAG: Minf_1886 family protein [Thermoguttaceae bacterium]
MSSLSGMESFFELLRTDRRYRAEAYRFVFGALDYAQNTLDLAVTASILDDDSPQHVTGQDLCRAACLYAQKEYGFLARSVLRDMGIRSTSDLGEIVYNLIRIGQMNKTDEDSRADFDNVLDLDAWFDKYQICDGKQRT